MENSTTKPFYNTTIPSDWEVKQLEELVLDMKSGLSRELSIEDIGLPVIRSNNLIDNRVDFVEIKYWHTIDNQGAKTENYFLTDGDILVNFINSISQIGKCAYFKNDINRPVIFTTNILVVRFDKSKIDSRFFLYYSLQSHYKKFVDSITKPAINQASFTTKDYKKLILPLPPLPEQQAISHVLGLMDSLINQNNQLIAQKELRKKWLMQNLLTGKKRLKGFGGVWKEVHIRDVAKEVSVKNKDNKQLTVLSCTKYDGLVESLEYWGRKIFADDISTYKIVPKNHFAYATNHIEEGSIGYQETFGEALISPMYTVFKTNSSINDLYFYKLLKSHMLMYQYQNRMEGSIDRRGGLRWDAFSIIKIHIPSYEEQTAITQVLQAADKEIQLLKAKTDKLREQKKGMMQVLLTGKKRLKI